nr:MAG TPA: hypothetical protein [Caudoviricetes sp.]
MQNKELVIVFYNNLQCIFYLHFFQATNFLAHST